MTIIETKTVRNFKVSRKSQVYWKCLILSFPNLYRYPMWNLHIDPAINRQRFNRKHDTTDICIMSPISRFEGNIDRSKVSKVFLIGFMSDGESEINTAFYCHCYSIYSILNAPLAYETKRETPLVPLVKGYNYFDINWVLNYAFLF